MTDHVREREREGESERAMKDKCKVEWSGSTPPVLVTLHRGARWEPDRSHHESCFTRSRPCLGPRLALALVLQPLAQKKRRAVASLSSPPHLPNCMASRVPWRGQTMRATPFAWDSRSCREVYGEVPIPVHIKSMRLIPLPKRMLTEYQL